MRDGEEKKIEAELVFVYQAPDESVGINGGLGFLGFEHDGKPYLMNYEQHVEGLYGSLPRRDQIADMIKGCVTHGDRERTAELILRLVQTCLRAKAKYVYVMEAASSAAMGKLAQDLMESELDRIMEPDDGEE